jgi:hypothetical protein
MGVDVIQNLGGTDNCAISIYDAGLARDNTRWMPARTQDIQQPAYLTSTISNSVINTSATITLGLSSTYLSPNVNDAVSCVINAGSLFGAQVYSSVSGDTTTTIATQLKNQINSDSVLSTLVSATSSGRVVTLTNKTTSQLGLQSYVGNIDSRQIEYSRINRHVQVVIWCGSESVREIVGAQIESLLGALRAKFGVQMPDGTWTWVRYDGDQLSEEETLKNVYRRDIYIDVEYSVTGADTAYAVLAPIPVYSGASSFSTTLKTILKAINNVVQPSSFVASFNVLRGRLYSRLYNFVQSSSFAASLNVLRGNLYQRSYSFAQSSSLNVLKAISKTLTGAVQSSSLTVLKSISKTLSGFSQSSSFTSSSTTIPAANLVLDQLSATSSAAYSLRKLRSGYAGKAINVRRSSDNTSTDIGFVGNVLDTATVLSFVGSGNGYITAWYDQSGNGNNATQSTAVNQPQIVSSGTVIAMPGGSLPSLYFNGSNALATPTSVIANLATSAGFAVSSLFYITSTGLATPFDTSPRELALFSPTGYYTVGTGQGNLVPPYPGNAWNISTFEYTGTAGGASVYVYNNGSLQTTLAGSALATTGISIYLGYNISGGGTNLTGYIPEMIFLNSYLSTTDRQTLEHNQESFYGITGI